RTAPLVATKAKLTTAVNCRRMASPLLIAPWRACHSHGTMRIMQCGCRHWSRKKAPAIKDAMPADGTFLAALATNGDTGTSRLQSSFGRSSRPTSSYIRSTPRPKDRAGWRACPILVRVTATGHLAACIYGIFIIQDRYVLEASRVISLRRVWAPRLLIRLEIKPVARVACHPQLRHIRLEVAVLLCAAGAVGDLRRRRRPGIEIGVVGEKVGRRIGVAAGIALDVGLPLIGGRGEEMRKRHQHDRDHVGMLAALGQIDALVRCRHGLELVHVGADGIHQDLARENGVLGNRGALILARRQRTHADS